MPDPTIASEEVPHVLKLLSQMWMAAMSYVEDATHPFWTSAIIAELICLIVENHIWDAVPGNPSYNLITVRWVVK